MLAHHQMCASQKHQNLATYSALKSLFLADNTNIPTLRAQEWLQDRVFVELVGHGGVFLPVALYVTWA